MFCVLRVRILRDMNRRLQLTTGLGATFATAAIATGLFTVPSRAIEPPAVLQPPTQAAATLHEGDVGFWEHPLIHEASTPTGVPCGAPGSSCVDYRIQVEDPGWRLRVALDHPTATDSFGLQLIDPDGVPVTATAQPTRDAISSNVGTFTEELYASTPKPGAWTARVTLRNVTDSGFRMRAALEAEPVLPSPPVVTLPNLTTIPPFEFTFATTSPDGGCGITERADYGVERCFRFATGVSNTGPGPLALDFAPGQLEGTAMQRIYSSDGTYTSRPAGQFHFHVEHQHYHHELVANLRLYPVLNRHSGKLGTPLAAPKIGFCTADYLIADWNHVVQAPPRDHTTAVRDCGNNGGVGSAPAGASMSLSTGWGDVYAAATPGDFIDFKGQPDGFYVAQLASDPNGNVLETDETDNVAYAYVEVRGNTITVLERGIGTSPWDKHKRIVDDTRPANSDVP
jgi:hypothetical protein